MKVVADPTWLTSLSKEALSRVSHNNSRITDGSDQVLVNPAFTEVTDARVLQDVADILAKYPLTDQLQKVEDSQMSKFGPRSIAVPWVDRKESLFAYFKHNDYDPGEFASHGGRLRPVGTDVVKQNLLKSSSAGLPYMTKKGLVLEEAFSNYNEELGVYPCVLYTRTQEQEKTRNVWGYPVSDTIFEQSFHIPWLQREKKLKWRSALSGPDAVDRAMTAMLTHKTDDELVVCVDFSQYDASVSPEYSYNAFQGIASNFQNSSGEDLYRLYRRFVTMPIYTPDGEVIGPHGVPSGSSFTNTVDSLVQYLASGMTYECQIQGDDGCYLVKRSERDSFAERFKEAGLILNESKSETYDSQEAIYLQRYYHPLYRNKSTGGLGGVYSAYRAFNRIKYLERWTNMDRIGMEGSDFFALRTIMILENCKHHPAFPDIVRLAQSYDKKGLAFSQQGVTAFSRAMESKARAGVFNGNLTEVGVHRFETVKLLKT